MKRLNEKSHEKALIKFCMFLPSMWLGVGPKETNKILAPMGLGLFCQLLTSPKSPLIIFNTIIRI